MESVRGAGSRPSGVIVFPAASWRGRGSTTCDALGAAVVGGSPRCVAMQLRVLRSAQIRSAKNSAHTDSTLDRGRDGPQFRGAQAVKRRCPPFIRQLFAPLRRAAA